MLAFSTAYCLQLPDFLSSPGLYNNLTSTLLPASVTISHSFNPSTVKVIISWYSSTVCTCFLHRYISYFDSPAGSEVNIQHIMAWRFPVWYFFNFVLRKSMCISAFGLSLSSSNFFVLLFINSAISLCFLVAIFNRSSFASTFWFISSTCTVIFFVLPFPLCSYIFQRLSFVLSFLPVFVDFLSAFPVDFPILVLIFPSYFLRESQVSHKLISSRHRLVYLIRFYYSSIYKVILENDTHELLWDFDIQTDHLHSARSPDIIIINKKWVFAKSWTLLSRLTTE